MYSRDQLIKFLTDALGQDEKFKEMTLKELMDRYDITKRETSYGLTSSSSVWTTVSNASTLAVPSFVFTPNGFGPYFVTWEPVDETAEIETFKGNLDKIAESKSESIDNPSPNIGQSPDYMYALTGWRGWGVQGRKLKSLGQNAYWEPKQKVQATCITHGHNAPDRNCHCGYWSFKSYDLLKEALVSYRNNTMVVGSVEIWGKVIECENGYRSEYAYPKELYLLKPNLEYLSWTYGVPVKK